MSGPDTRYPPGSNHSAPPGPKPTPPPNQPRTTEAARRRDLFTLAALAALSQVPRPLRAADLGYAAVGLVDQIIEKLNAEVQP